MASNHSGAGLQDAGSGKEIENYFQELFKDICHLLCHVTSFRLLSIKKQPFHDT